MLLQRTNQRPAVDVLIRLERDSPVALHRQIEASLRDAIRSGRLARGTALPPTRGLASELGVSRGVVVEAYQQLVAEGYLTSRSGGYTRVAIGPELTAPRSAAAADWVPGIDFCPYRADGSQFPRAAWLRSVRRVLTRASDEDFGHVSARGVPALHFALAEYLNRVRGASARADAIVICNGYAQGIGLVIGVLAAAGAKRLAVEDPSVDDYAVPQARAAGLEVVGVPVDEDGIRVDALDGVDADAVVLTPSHQWPTGAVLSAERRAAVLRWAQRRNALVIEDDYDAEYRYDRAPIGAVQGLAPDRVLYAGTASKTLAPGLRLGWLVVPPHLLDAIADGQAAGRSRLARARPAGLRRLPVVRRVRPPRAPHAAALSPAPRRAAHRLAGHTRPTSSRRASPRACTSSPTCRTTSTSGASSRRRSARGVALYGLAPYRLGIRGPPGPDLRLRHTQRAIDHDGHRDPCSRDRRPAREWMKNATVTSRTATSATRVAVSPALVDGLRERVADQR